MIDDPATGTRVIPGAETTQRREISGGTSPGQSAIEADFGLSSAAVTDALQIMASGSDADVLVVINAWVKSGHGT